MNKATGQKLALHQRMDIYTVQQYNFEKHGLFLSPAKSKFMQKVRKETHFINLEKSTKKGRESANSNKTGGKVGETLFDVSDEMIGKDPFTYEQF